MKPTVVVIFKGPRFEGPTGLQRIDPRGAQGSVEAAGRAARLR